MGERDKNMENVNFLPWIGSNYETEGLHGKKIMLLGEAHYGEIKETNPLNVTRAVVQDLGIKHRHSFFTKLARLMLLNRGHPLTDDARVEFWNRITFYNYCQEIVADKARVRPTDVIWKSSEPALQEVLQELNPDLVVVLGKELSSKIPNISARYAVCNVNHPSSGFSYNKWIPVVRDKLLELGPGEFTEI